MRPFFNVFSSRNCGLTVVTACILNFSWHPQTVHCFNMKHTIFTFNSTLSFCPETLQGMKPTILKQSHPPTLICDCSLGKNQTLTYSYQMVVFFCADFHPMVVKNHYGKNQQMNKHKPKLGQPLFRPISTPDVFLENPPKDQSKVAATNTWPNDGVAPLNKIGEFFSHLTTRGFGSGFTTR